jgi:preprotein translocase subunit YajC
MGNYQSIVIMLVLFGAMYFVLIRPQNKKDKEEREMRNNLQVGDEVMTVGGIVGKIVRIREDRVTIATGAEKTKIEFTRNAINQKVSGSSSGSSKSSSEEKEAPKAKKIKKLGQKEETPAEAAAPAPAEEAPAMPAVDAEAVVEAAEEVTAE